MRSFPKMWVSVIHINNMTRLLVVLFEQCLFTVRYVLTVGQWPSLSWCVYQTKNQYIFSTWQDDWNGAVANMLHSVKPVLGHWQSSYRRCRKDEVVLCRARIGHTYVTHSYILKKDPPPQCEDCQCILMVRSDKKWYICKMWCGGIFSIPPWISFKFLRDSAFYSKF